MALNVDQELEITVGDVRYLLIPEPENFISYLKYAFKRRDTPYLFLVYAAAAGQTITRTAFCRFRDGSLESDDVFQPDFCSYILLMADNDSAIQVKADDLRELVPYPIKSCVNIRRNLLKTTPRGPYVYYRGKTWQPWRVYHDFNACFMTALKPSLVAVDAPRAGMDGRVVVPSRCYFDATSRTHALQGARISIKDSIDIAGHKTTLCNRAWIDLHPARTKNAPCVQTLIDASAIIVGKVKLQAMLMREEPLESVEFTAPFNPRADGYQAPSGSSHGSAAGVASYDWLDFSVGSDTSGGGRKPASSNGCFSLRPSSGALNKEGVAGYFREFDTPVVFSRDISRFSDFISVWYGNSLMLRHTALHNVEILYPADYLPTENMAQTHLIEQFVAGLESALGVRRTNIFLAELWKEHLPDGPEHADIAMYLLSAAINPFYHSQYRCLDAFRKQYTEKHGKPPFVHRSLSWQRETGRVISEAERDEGWRRSEVYRHWLLDKVFATEDQRVVRIMVLPVEDGNPKYRDADPTAYSLLSGYAALNMAPIARAPEITAPIGVIPYISHVTEREEPLPIAVSVIGAPGTDLLLAEVVERGMKGAGLPLTVKTGPSMY